MCSSDLLTKRTSLSQEPLYRLIWDLILGLIWGLADIETVEVLKLSSRFARKKFFNTFILGLIVGLIEDFRTTEIPNQGIIASARNIPFIAVMSYIPGVVLQFALFRAVTITEPTNLVTVIVFSLIGGLDWALLFSFERS